MSPSSIETIIVAYVCPSLGAIMATAMFAAPIPALKRALRQGSLGQLNPLPWAFMTGNCLGWVAYGYYTLDPFVVAANAPGLILSLWLNTCAIKLQYMEQAGETIAYQATSRRQEESTSCAEETSGNALMEDDQGTLELAEEEYDANHVGIREVNLVSSQESVLLKIVGAWLLLFTYLILGRVGSPVKIVGLVVNTNLVFFYGAPLNAICRVLTTRSSGFINRPTMVMTMTNTSFWMAYSGGIPHWDPYIFVPNASGFFLGVIQAFLCVMFPSKQHAVRRGSEDYESQGEVQPSRSSQSESGLI